MVYIIGIVAAGIDHYHMPDYLDYVFLRQGSLVLETFSPSRLLSL
jgi:hypothetical protein